MIWWTLQWIIVSLTLIALLHYLYTFFKNTLTIPKIKDLVHKPSESYNEIMNTIQKTSTSTSTTTTSLLPNNNNNNNNNNDDDSMQDELKNFLNELKKPKNTSSEQTKQNNTNTYEAANDFSTFSTSFSSY